MRASEGGFYILAKALVASGFLTDDEILAGAAADRFHAPLAQWLRTIAAARVAHTVLTDAAGSNRPTTAMTAATP